MSQAELARDSGIDPSTISRLEEGKRSPTTHTLVRLSECLQVPLADIVDIKNEYFEEHTDAFLLKECVALLKKLDPEEQDTAMTMLRVFVSMKRKAESKRKKSEIEND